MYRPRSVPFQLYSSLFILLILSPSSIEAYGTYPRSSSGSSSSYHSHNPPTFDRCFRTICKDWMHECHWFCDPIDGKMNYWRCMECLSHRGNHCFECFDL